MSMQRTTLAPGQLLRSVHMEKSYLGIAQRVTHLSKLSRGNEKLMRTVTGVRPCTEAKLTPGSVNCPRATNCPGIM